MYLANTLKKLGLVFLILFGLIIGKEFLIPLFIGAIISALFLPICKWLELKKTPRFLAVFLCLMLLISLVFGVLWLVFSQVSGIVNDFELLKDSFLIKSSELSQFINEKFGITIESQMSLFNNQKNIFSLMIPSMAGSFLGVLFKFFLVLVYMFSFLFYRQHLKTFIMKLSNNERTKETETTIHKVSKVSQQYLLGLAKMIFLLWILYGIGFSIIGVKNALFFAILCGILEIVPFIGNLTGTIITILVAAVQGLTMPYLIAIAGTYGLIQFIQGWFLEPLILGPQVKLNPLFTIIALLLGEIIWGISGIFLAIPIMAMLKIIFDSVESLQPFGFLIGETNTKTLKTL